MRWPDSLISDIAARRAVLFFGAGISMNSRSAKGASPKSWWGFLNSAIDRIDDQERKTIKDVKSLLKSNDLLTACEVIKRCLGRDEFIELMKDEFQRPGFEPAEIHECLWKLDFRMAITPNFDTIYETLTARRGNGTVLIKNYHDDDIAESLRRPERIVIKSHGSIGSPNKLIFSRIDYAKARNTHRGFYELLSSLLCTNTFLFVGCGLEDPDIRMLLEDYQYRHGFSRQHYFALASNRFSGYVKNVFAESLNLKFVEYRYTQDHSELLVGLKDLLPRVEQLRIDMGRRTEW
jgi:hypothetical protein